VVSIGVSGHRFLTEVEKLKAGIDQVLIRIDQIYPGETWEVISALAEGADRLVVERVHQFKRPVRLIVPLPMAVDEYQKDFSSQESRDEFHKLLGAAEEVVRLPGAASREGGYWAAGEYLLDHSTLLIVLWDGQSALGKGGTGEVAEAARKRGIPLAWVQCGNRQPGTIQPTPPGVEQGTVLFERF